MSDNVAAFIAPLLAVERRARELLERHPKGDGILWRIDAGDDDTGLVGLAAARLAESVGATVTLRLGPPAGAGELWRILAEPFLRMNMEHISAPENLRVEAAASPLPGVITVSRPGGADTACPPPPDGAIWRRVYRGGGDWVVPIGGKNPTSAAAFSRFTCAEAREVDRRAIEDYGVPSLCLMENAAVGAMQIAQALLNAAPSAGPARERRVAIVVGGGNNGGDGLVMARGFAEIGVGVTVLLCKPAETLRGDAAANHALLRAVPANPAVRIIACHETLDPVPAAVAESDLVVDALLGTGFRGGLSPHFRQAIRLVNAGASENGAAKPVLALDLPSGMNGDDGTVDGDAIRAAATVTFAVVKKGLAVPKAGRFVGELYLAGIGAPQGCLP